MILDRKEAIAVRQDPFGTTWGIRTQNKENSFWVVGKVVADKEISIPSTYPTEAFEGKWTKPQDALLAISVYLEQAWDFADAEAAKNVRKDKNNKIEDKRLKIEANQEAA